MVNLTRISKPKVKAPDPETSPGHTDLMVDPETIDDFMERNPLPQPAADAMATLETLVLSVLRANMDHSPEAPYTRLRTLSEATGIPGEVVRALMLGLVDKGLAVYGKGLLTETGAMFGSGYAVKADV